MEKSTIAIIILIITLVLYIADKIPIAVTALLSAFAMAATGCIQYNEAFSGFSNTAVLMTVGLSIVSGAFFTTGLADRIGDRFLRMKNLTEKKFLIAAYITAAVISSVMNGLLVIALFMPIVDTLARKTKGKITRKNCYLPLAIASLYGGNLSNIGSSSMVNASGQMAASYVGRPFGFFEPFWMGLGGTLIGLVILLVFGTKLQERFFDFPETEGEYPAISAELHEELHVVNTGRRWKQ